MSPLVYFLVLKLDTLVNLLIFGGFVSAVCSGLGLVVFSEDERKKWGVSSKRVLRISLLCFLTGVFLPSSCFMLNALGGVCK